MSVYLFTGDESYLMEKALGRLYHKVIAPGMEALSHKVLKNPPIHSVIEAVTAVYLQLGGDTLIEIEDFAYLSKAAEPTLEEKQLDMLKEALQDLPPNKHVLFCARKMDRKIKFAKWLTTQKFVQIEEFKKLNFWETEKAADFILREAKAQGIDIQPQAALLLVENMGVELQPLINELQKLSLYAYPGSITPDAVKTLSGHNENTFQMLSRWLSAAPLQPDSARAEAFQILDEILLKQDHLQPLFAATQTRLVYFFWIHLWRRLGLSEADIAERLKKNPWSIKNDWQKIANIPFSRLETLKASALEMEYQMKTGQLDGRLAYELLIGS